MELFQKSSVDELAAIHKNEHEGYAHVRRKFVPFRQGGQCTVSVYELLPGNSMCPYHYHMQNEEVFYIISGTGRLLTPQGEQTVTAGELLFFPANENGAHKLTNCSETEPLRYIDFDTSNAIDVAIYPHSGKVGVWGKDVNKVYRMEDAVAYYDGE